MNPGKPLSVLFSLCGDSHKASSRVRGFWVAAALETQGMQCSIRHSHSKMALLRFALLMWQHDVIIFQKTYSRYHRWLMALARLLGKRTYLDLDDAPSRTRSPVTIHNIESMMRMADGVFVGNRNLFKYAEKQQSAVYLIPSAINLQFYKPNEKANERGRITLGWIGHGAHYQEDLIQILLAPIEHLASRYPLRLKIVGACASRELYRAFSAVPELEIDFIDEIDWSDADRVSRAIKDFDIGLFPLLNNDFNRFKCGFKALEYMAIGIPVIASPIAINSDIISDGRDGLLASSEAEWIEALSSLIEDSELRSKMGETGRRKVETTFDVNRVASQVKAVLDRHHDACSPGTKT